MINHFTTLQMRTRAISRGKKNKKQTFNERANAFDKSIVAVLSDNAAMQATEHVLQALKFDCVLRRFVAINVEFVAKDWEKFGPKSTIVLNREKVRDFETRK